MRNYVCNNHHRHCPLRAHIRYTDGSPKPPGRFTKKLAAWER